MARGLASLASAHTARRLGDHEFNNQGAGLAQASALQTSRSSHSASPREGSKVSRGSSQRAITAPRDERMATSVRPKAVQAATQHMDGYERISAGRRRTSGGRHLRQEISGEIQGAEAVGGRPERQPQQSTADILLRGTRSRLDRPGRVAALGPNGQGVPETSRSAAHAAAQLGRWEHRAPHPRSDSPRSSPPCSANWQRPKNVSP